MDFLVYFWSAQISDRVCFVEAESGDFDWSLIARFCGQQYPVTTFCCFYFKQTRFT